MKILTLTIVVIFAFLFSLFTLWLMKAWIKYPLFLLEIIIILALYLIVSGYDVRIVIKIKQMRIKYLSKGLIIDFLLIIFATILLIFNILQINEGLLRLILALLCTSFLSGYAILNISGLKHYFSKLEIMVLSFILSYAFTGFLASAILTLNENTRVLVALSSFIALGLTSAKCRKIRKNPFLKSFSFNQNFDILALILITTFYFIAFYTIYPSFALLYGSDVQRYYAYSILLFRTPELFKAFNYILYNLYEGFSIILSKGNALDLSSFQPTFTSSLAFLSLILPLSFYLMAKEYLAPIDRRLPILSTVIWSFFSGFSWLYLFKLKAEGVNDSPLSLLLQVNNKSNGIFWYHTKPEILWFDPSTVAFSIFMLQLFLMRKFNIPRLKYIALFSMLTVIGFLTHVYETIILAMSFSLYCMISSAKNVRVNDSLKGFLIGLIFITLSLFFRGVVSELPLDLTMAIFISFLLIIFTLILRQKNHLPLKIEKDAHKKLKIVAITITVIGLLIYGISLLTWLYDAETYTLSSIIEIHFVPWFMYPVLLGITGLFTIISLPLIVKHEHLRHNINIFPVFLIFFLLFGRMLSYVNLYLIPVSITEDRLLEFSFIPCSIMASITLLLLHDLLYKFKKKSFFMRIMSLSLVAMVAICGLQTTFIKIEYWNMRTDPKIGDLTSREELKALNFLYNLFAVDKYALAASITRESLLKLDFSVPPMKITYPNILFSAKWPETALIYLRAPLSSHPYLYLTERDMKALNQYYGGWMARHLIPMLPKIYDYGGVKIYNISEISFPQDNASTALIIPFDKSLDLEENWLFAYDLLSQGKYSYSVFYDLDTRALLNPISILSFDPPKNDTPRKIELIKSPQYWYNVSGSWQFIKEGLLGSGGQPGRYSEATIISSISPEGYFNIISEFKLLDGDPNVPNYVTIIYDWINPTNYKAAGLCLTRDGVYAYFATYKGSEIKIYPAWPGANTGLKWNVGDSFKLTLSISSTGSAIYVNDSKIYSISNIPYEGGKIGLRVTRLYNVLFTEIFITTNPPSYIRPVNEYLKYVEKGGTLIVLNTNGYGYFTDYMLMRKENRIQANKIINTKGDVITNIPLLWVEVFMEKRENTKPLAYYSSGEGALSIYAIEENIGAGKLVLVNVYPIISVVKNSSAGPLVYTINSKLLAPVSIYLENFEYATKSIVATFKEVMLDGIFEINSSAIIFPKNLLLREVSLNLGDRAMSLKNITQLNTINVTNVNIIGIGHLMISNGFGFYSNLRILGDVSINVTGNNVSLALITKENKTLVITSNIIAINIQCDNPVNFVLRQPQIIVKGDFYFKELYSSGKIYQKTRCDGKDLSGNGMINLTIHVSDTYTYASNLDIQGTLVRKPPLLPFNELLIFNN